MYVHGHTSKVPKVPRFLVPLVLALLMPVVLCAQSGLRGIVVDQSGGALVGARVEVVSADGIVIASTLADAGGRFQFEALVAGSYRLRAQFDLFEPLEQALAVPSRAAERPLTLVLLAAGMREDVVVTGRRIASRIAETPHKIEIVDAADIERSVASDLTDLLKKNAGVDVVQYSGVLSGIGIRGFRPQFSGINKRSLLLIDGRPSGVTNLATLLLDNVDRIEVLKGAASSIYGSSAMGGVVNVLTRRSRGAIAGNARLSLGSYDTSEIAGVVGGSLGARVDFDASGSTLDQRDDFRMGNGDVRPATSYQTYDGALRIGVDLTRSWRLDGKVESYRGRDIMTPGELASGLNSQGSKDLERTTTDLATSFDLGSHHLSATFYQAQEAGETSNVTSTNALDRPYLPYLSFTSALDWIGAQIKDSWEWTRGQGIVVGLDYEQVGSTSRSFTRTGAASAPFSADSEKDSTGFYAEHTSFWRDGRTVLAAGGRLDVITVRTLETPLKTNFTPSSTTFGVFNPSIGVKHQLLSGLRAHFTAGRAFIPAEPSMLTGFTESVVGGRTQVTQGNPDLKPERSTSFDAGADWTTARSFVDVTYFQTVVSERFISNVVVSNPPAPAPVVVSVANGLSSHIRGLDVDAQHRLSAHVGAFANITHYFTRTDTLASGATQNILNVAADTVRGGVDLDWGRLSGRLSARYVHGRQDNNFNVAGSPIVDYDDFTVVDATTTVRLTRRHSILAGVNNVTDAFYYEKMGFPLQGTSFKLTYRLGF